MFSDTVFFLCAFVQGFFFTENLNPTRGVRAFSLNFNTCSHFIHSFKNLVRIFRATAFTFSSFILKK